MVLPLNNYDWDDKTGDYNTKIEHEKHRYQRCPICGELAIIDDVPISFDGVLICDNCGHREAR